jgi:hypothetical protein
MLSPYLRKIDTTNRFVNNISRTVGKDSIIFNIGSTRYAIKDSVGSGTSYTFSTGLTNSSGTVTSNLSTGVSGGQSVVGGTAASNSLTLSSTSNATKGKLLFGTSAYDEVNNRLGIGTASPAYPLDVNLGNSGNVRLIGGSSNNNGFIQAAFSNYLFSSNLYYDGTNFRYEKAGYGALVQTESSTGTVQLGVAPSGSASAIATYTSALTAYNSRNIGINTSTDAGYRLDVNGTARVQGDLTSSAAFKSVIGGNTTAQFTASNPSSVYPRAQFQIGYSSSDVNVGLTVAPLYSSSGVQKPAFIQVSTNSNTTDAGQFGGTLICSTTAFNISSAKSDGTVSGGVPITFSPANTEAMRLNTSGNIQFPATNTASGTTGNQTINKTSGTVNIAAAGTTVTVTNSLVTASSIVYAVIRTNDATATIKNVVPAAGSFVINLGAATTAEVSIGFFVIN